MKSKQLQGIRFAYRSGKGDFFRTLFACTNGGREGEENEQAFERCGCWIWGLEMGWGVPVDDFYLFDPVVDSREFRHLSLKTENKHASARDLLSSLLDGMSSRG